jgi:hypothetical protein
VALGPRRGAAAIRRGAFAYFHDFLLVEGSNPTLQSQACVSNPQPRSSQQENFLSQQALEGVQASRQDYAAVGRCTLCILLP